MLNLFSIGSGYHEDNPVMSGINILCFFSYKWIHILIKRKKKCECVCVCVQLTREDLQQKEQTMLPGNSDFQK